MKNFELKFSLMVKNKINQINEEILQLIKNNNGIQTQISEINKEISMLSKIEKSIQKDFFIFVGEIDLKGEKKKLICHLIVN